MSDKQTTKDDAKATAPSTPATATAPPPPTERPTDETEEATVYRYKPAKDGVYLSGVPQRDLTERDVIRLRGRIANVEASPLYEAVKPKKKG